jgi:hypothetical protein
MNREQTIHTLERFWEKGRLVGDEYFVAINPGSKPWQGEPVSGEDAFFLATERGYRFTKENVTDWQRFKELVSGHNMLAITTAMWKEDIHFGRLSVDELVEDGFGDIGKKLCKAAITRDKNEGKWWMKQSEGESINDLKKDYRPLAGGGMGASALISACNRM